MSDSAQQRLTFFSKSSIKCPVCTGTFYREELFTGRGRLIAGDLTIELRRRYEPSQKFGEVVPLIYPVQVCPSCYYSAYPQDFLLVPEAKKRILEEETEKRLSSIRLLFDNLNFNEPRTLNEGAASYFLAVMCYDYFNKDVAPTFKQALSCVRAAWLFTDLHRKLSNDNFDYVAKLFYRKARFFYSLAIQKEQTGKESLSSVKHMGPDIDKNYGYDGVLYLTGYLEYKYGPSESPEKRMEALKSAKRTVARIFGMGKASKDKPSAILDMAKELYSLINDELAQLGSTEEPDEEEHGES